MSPQPQAVSRRRLLQQSLTLGGLGLLTGCGVPLIPWARRSRLYRVGFLQPNTVESSGLYFEAFRQGLAELGYVEGQTITIDVRYANSSEERLHTLAAELAGADVDVIVTS